MLSILADSCAEARPGSPVECDCESLTATDSLKERYAFRKIGSRSALASRFQRAFPRRTVEWVATFVRFGRNGVQVRVSCVPVSMLRRDPVRCGGLMEDPGPVRCGCNSRSSSSMIL